ncbi:MAG: sigma-70 family RNA polymerase sigma factor [Verrucomicrobiaceae bacterium]|nr:sigma-70 family RNA polymerase sigma factor [Verrucomicrobiaceae bacterium]
MTSTPQPNLHAAPFHTTRWTRVCLAKADSEDGRRALADLCDAYYEPVVAFLRFELRDADRAMDVAHAFFAQMLQGGTIGAAQQERGRFRSYLLGAVKHFLAHEREKNRSLKRGGGAEVFSMDAAVAAAHAIPDATQLSADAAYDRQWALTVLAHAMDRLRDECAAQRKTELFDQIKPWLTGDAGHGDQAALAAACGMGVSALKMTIQRLRQRFREHLLEEISGTLDDPAHAQEEMRSLIAALAA